MSNACSGFDPLDDLVESFLERYRGGERPVAHRIRQQTSRACRADPLPIPVVGRHGRACLRKRCGPRGHERPGLAGQRAARRLGDYVLLRAVGSGGMGIVYEAIQESLGRRVALKVLPVQQLGDSTRLERFRREARAAARLRHNHIVPVFGVGECDGLHYYTMQFIRGHGLDTILREVNRVLANPTSHSDLAAGTEDVRPETLAWGLCIGRFLTALSRAEESTLDHPSGELPGFATGSERTTHAVPHRRRSSRADDSFRERLHSRRGVDWRQGGRALEYAHEQGILHRDIKPSNLVLDAQGQVWVTDFGLAKAHDSDELTRTGDIVGTLRYMAPERFNGWSDTRSDVYALGATLYELLALRPAFADSDRVKLIERVLHETPPPLRHLDRRVPRDLETIVLKSLAKEPGERYSTAGQLAEDLRRFVAGRPILARRSSAIERSWRWGKRNPVLAMATGTVAAALVAVAVIAIFYANRQRQFAAAQSSATQRITGLVHDLERIAGRIEPAARNSQL